jgi:hypothetical protein
MPDASLRRAYRSLLGRLRMRRGLEAAAIAACVTAIGALAGTAPGHSAIIAAAAWALAYLGLGMLSAYRGISPPVFAEHLNRRFPELEDSTQLMLIDAARLTPMQQLQRSRVARVLASALADRRKWLPPVTGAATLSVLAAASVLVLLAAPIRNAMMSASASISSSQPAPAGSVQDSLIAAAEVLIEPPAYTGIDARVTDSLDLELPEGSTVTWRLRFRQPGPYALVIGDEQAVTMEPGPDDTHVARARIDRTSLYRIVTEIDGGEQALAAVYTLSVSLDKPPRVRVVEPDETAVEIERGDPARFASRVVVSDDFGLGRVEIRASVARGSGEGVKFRDEVFDFDTQLALDAGAASRSYSRAWDLERLGMEPGDEVYFFAVAHDNREPQPNVSRSDTVVVRWLDEAPKVVGFGDLAIDVMPDYYKSQRQIIIETEQLIADRDLLEEETFAATSRALAESQAALKNRYGQYLGDEFDESLDGDVDLPELAESLEPEAVAEAHDDHAGHAEPGAEQAGSAEALLARFIHDHGSADIGPVSSRNPVGLMKRAVAKMWESELHLRLSDPVESLPHQYEALEYYNRAREADRIFTRRLGFEPPPVTEDRRLTGDISDVRSDRVEEPRPESRSDDQLFRELHDRLSRRSPTEPFDPDELELLARAADRLQQLSADRPALIKQAAQLEQLRAAGGPADEACEDCVADAIRAAWSVLSSLRAQPVQGARPVAADDPLTRDYAGLGEAIE